MASDSGPGERLLRHGADSLSDADLLSVLFKGRVTAAQKLARDLISDYGSLAGLAESKGSYRTWAGMTNGRAVSLLAAFEIACRLARERLPIRELLDRPDSVANYLRLRYSQQDQEVMGALYLDVRNRLIAERELFRGTLTRAAVEPRAILKEGLLRSASGFILFHTHPSGDPAPSEADCYFTQRMTEAGELVGIRLVDHVILGSGGRWISLRRQLH